MFIYEKEVYSSCSTWYIQGFRQSLACWSSSETRKFEPWFVLWSFFLLMLLCISINLPYDHVWDTFVMSGLVLLVATWNCWISYKLQKWICRTVGPSLAGSVKPLVHSRNVTSLSVFYRHLLGRCSSELAQLVPFPYWRGRSTRYSDRLHDFSVTITRCYKDVYVNSFFSRTARFWNSLPIDRMLSLYLWLYWL